MVAYGRRFERRRDTIKSRLTPAEVIVGVSGSALFALSIVPRWGSIETPSATLRNIGRLPGATGHFNAFYGYEWPLRVAVGLGALAAVVVLLRRAGDIAIPPVLYLVVGAAMTAGILFALLRGPELTPFNDVADVEVSRGPLLPAALIPSLLITIAGVGFARTHKGPRRRR